MHVRQSVCQVHPVFAHERPSKQGPQQVSDPPSSRDRRFRCRRCQRHQHLDDADSMTSQAPADACLIRTSKPFGHLHRFTFVLVQSVRAVFTLLPPLAVAAFLLRAFQTAAPRVESLGASPSHSDSRLHTIFGVVWPRGLGLTRHGLSPRCVRAITGALGACLLAKRSGQIHCQAPNRSHSVCRAGASLVEAKAKATSSASADPPNTREALF